jgi:lipopolysaccharide/colanic/teichoic acid biosynthesis glycosyltransferase
VRPTVIGIGIASAIVGATVWFLGTPLIHMVFFRHLAPGLIAWVSIRVVLRLYVGTAKASAQGAGDLPGSNLTILLEELLFLPAFGLLMTLKVHGAMLVIGALIIADIATGSIAWSRLVRRGFLAGAARPSLQLAWRIYKFAVRGQLGSLLTLLNLRFDFVVLAAIAGPAALGIYAVASKYAEVLRLLPIAANWVLYPRFARSDAAAAIASSRRLIPRAGVITVATGVPLAMAAGVVLPLVFGETFRAAAVPAQILLVGLAGEGVAGVITAFLYGRGRPGLNSLAAATGVIVTLVMDIILIPRFDAVGAAIASSAAYLTTTLMLVFWYWRVTRSTSRPSDNFRRPVIDDLPSVAPSAGRRVVDVVASLLALSLCWPLMLVLALASRLSTHASGIYTQVRVGQGGVPFPMYKFRSMGDGVGGPEITAPGDRRVTRVGALLRATSLDELPQLFNVLRGDMTLVGPRPETVALALRYPAECRVVFAHRPGITGPVQLELRDSVPDGVEDVESYYLSELLPKRLELDLGYLANPTLTRTLGLTFATASHVVSRFMGKVVTRSRVRISLVAGLKGTTTP